MMPLEVIYVNYWTYACSTRCVSLNLVSTAMSIQFGKFTDLLKYILPHFVLASSQSKQWLHWSLDVVDIGMAASTFNLTCHITILDVYIYMYIRISHTQSIRHGVNGLQVKIFLCQVTMLLVCVSLELSENIWYISLHAVNTVIEYTCL